MSLRHAEGQSGQSFYTAATSDTAATSRSPVVTTLQSPPTLIFVNLPVHDVARSGTFFRKLGYEIHPRYSDDDCACVVISSTIFVMLLSMPRFGDFTRKRVVDATTHTEAILSLSADSREAVDDLCDWALAAGGSVANDPVDQGFMYGRSFQDLDGHLWEVIWMDPAEVA
jgi:uncharacterized protein